eukprot:maker-scaffold_2-snap-gene-7.19-mRNA-1 protein AED:0.00 eAED:0.00 QI:0/1/1/1/0/0/2/4/486
MKSLTFNNAPSSSLRAECPSISVDEDKCIVKIAAFSMPPDASTLPSETSFSRFAGISFSGTITLVGETFKRNSRLRPGEDVFGVYFPKKTSKIRSLMNSLAPWRGDEHANGDSGNERGEKIKSVELISEFIVVCPDEISRKPLSMSHAQAATLAKVGVVSFVVLKEFAGTAFNDRRSGRCLIVDSVLSIEAIIMAQLAKGFNLQVVLCVYNPSKKVNGQLTQELRNLGVDEVLSFTNVEKAEGHFEKEGVFNVCIDMIRIKSSEVAEVRRIFKSSMRPRGKYVTRRVADNFLKDVYNQRRNSVGLGALGGFFVQGFSINLDTCLTNFSRKKRKSYLRSIARMADSRRLKLSPLVLKKLSSRNEIEKIYRQGTYFPFEQKSMEYLFQAGNLDGEASGALIKVVIVDEIQCGEEFKNGKSRVILNQRANSFRSQSFSTTTRTQSGFGGLKSMKKLRDSMKQKMKHITVRRKSSGVPTMAMSNDYYDYE